MFPQHELVVEHVFRFSIVNQAVDQPFRAFGLTGFFVVFCRGAFASCNLRDPHLVARASIWHAFHGFCVIRFVHFFNRVVGVNPPDRRNGTETLPIFFLIRLGTGVIFHVPGDDRASIAFFASSVRRVREMGRSGCFTGFIVTALVIWLVPCLYVACGMAQRFGLVEDILQLLLVFRRGLRTNRDLLCIRIGAQRDVERQSHAPGVFHPFDESFAVVRIFFFWGRHYVPLHHVSCKPYVSAVYPGVPEEAGEIAARKATVPGRETLVRDAIYIFGRGERRRLEENQEQHAHQHHCSRESTSRPVRPAPR